MSLYTDILNCIHDRLQQGHVAADLMNDVGLGDGTPIQCDENLELLENYDQIENKLTEITSSFSQEELIRDLDSNKFTLFKDLRTKLSFFLRNVHRLRKLREEPKSSTHNLLKVQLSIAPGTQKDLVDAIELSFKKLAAHYEKHLQNSTHSNLQDIVEEIKNLWQQDSIKIAIAKAYRTALRNTNVKQFQIQFAPQSPPERQSYRRSDRSRGYRTWRGAKYSRWRSDDLERRPRYNDSEQEEVYTSGRDVRWTSGRDRRQWSNRSHTGRQRIESADRLSDFSRSSHQSYGSTRSNQSGGSFRRVF